MTGERLDYKRRFSLQFGAYCQVHEEDTPRNSNVPRTKGAICIGPSGNQQGRFKFMALDTCAKITRRSWDLIPTPKTVIDRVNLLGKDQPEQLSFYNRKGLLIGDVEIPGVDGQPETLDLGDLDDLDEPQQLVELPALARMEDLTADPPEDQPIVADEASAELAPVEELAPTTTTEPKVELEPAFQPDEAATTAAPEQAKVEPVASPGVRHSGRVKFQAKESYVPSMTGSKYALAVTQLENHGALHPDAHMAFFQHSMEEQPDVVAAIMTQLSLKAGLKEWGEEAKEAVRSEMKQMHLRDTFKPMH